MKTRTLTMIVVVAATLSALAFGALPARAADPLPSWNDSAARTAIVRFVAKVTKPGTPDYVAEPERIAVFDNDGTLWVEHPMYTQLAFALDRVRAQAPSHPEWKTTQPFKAVLDNDWKALAAAGEKGLLELVMATHAGMSTTDFAASVTEWFRSARDPRFKRPYTELAYLPMVELLGYLRANGFKTYIVSGGGIEFMRPVTAAIYGIPPEQVIGSSIQTRYELRDGKPTLVRLPSVDFIDDKEGKPVAINRFIGRRPIAAFGNSAGDRQMLEWTAAGPGARLMMLIFHDDAKREYAYGPANSLPDTSFGAFPQSLMDQARKSNWTVVSMKDDWRTIFRPSPAPGYGAGAVEP